jgi:hypothetical protein
LTDVEVLAAVWSWCAETTDDDLCPMGEIAAAGCEVSGYLLDYTIITIEQFENEGG